MLTINTSHVSTNIFQIWYQNLRKFEEKLWAGSSTWEPQTCDFGPLLVTFLNGERMFKGIVMGVLSTCFCLPLFFFFKVPQAMVSFVILSEKCIFVYSHSKTTLVEMIILRYRSVRNFHSPGEIQKQSMIVYWFWHMYLAYPFKFYSFTNILKVINPFPHKHFFIEGRGGEGRSTHLTLHPHFWTRACPPIKLQICPWDFETLMHFLTKF